MMISLILHVNIIFEYECMKIEMEKTIRMVMYKRNANG